MQETAEQPRLPTLFHPAIGSRTKQLDASKPSLKRALAFVAVALMSTPAQAQSCAISYFFGQAPKVLPDCSVEPTKKVPVAEALSLLQDPVPVRRVPVPEFGSPLIWGVWSCYICSVADFTPNGTPQANTEAPAKTTP